MSVMDKQDVLMEVFGELEYIRQIQMCTELLSIWAISQVCFTELICQVFKDTKEQP